MTMVPVGAAAGFAILIGFAALVPAASAPSDTPARVEMPLPELKRAYVGCERAALAGGLGAGSTMQCSILYEELKRRAFGRDAGRLRSWWKARIADADRM